MPHATTKAIRFTVIAAATAVGSLVGSVAIAQDLNQTISCVAGQVEAFDYTELMENFREGTWDMRAGLQLVSDSEAITLQVLDLNNTSICEKVADVRTRCDFALGINTNFTVKVINLDGPTYVKFRLCAY